MYLHISCVHVCLYVCGFQWFNSVAWVSKSMALDNNNLASLSLLQRSGICSLFSATSLERRTKLLDFVRRVYLVKEGRRKGGLTRGFWEWSGSGSRGRMRGWRTWGRVLQCVPCERCLHMIFRIRMSTRAMRSWLWSLSPSSLFPPITCISCCIS